MVACIVVLDPRMDVTILRHLSDAHCVCAQVTTASGSYYVVSWIAAAQDPAKIIIGMDANARSPLWFSGTADPRGEALEDLIAETGWLIRNEAGNPPTFQTVNGRSNPDVTLTSPGAWTTIYQWKVRVGWTSSDHRVLQLTLGAPSISASIRSSRFNTRLADWTLFAETYEDLTRDEPPPPTGRDETEQQARAITNRIKLCAEVSMPFKIRYPRSVPWWTADLTRLKRRCNRARRRSQRARTEEEKTETAAAYRYVRRLYTNTIHQAKMNSWRQFITDRGNEEAYGIAYKIFRKKVTVDDTMTSLGSGDDFSQTWEDSATRLLDALIPTAPPEMGIERCYNPLTFSGDRSTRRWTLDEVIKAVRKTPIGKAPGDDGVESLMLRKLIRLADLPPNPHECL